MARIRMIKPEFFDDPQIAELSPLAQLFFIGLWMQADREGRLVDDVKRLKARIFPYYEVDTEALAVELHGQDLIRRYLDVDGSRGYIWIRSFSKHQRPHPKEPQSVIPEWTPDAVKRHCGPCKNISGNETNGTRNLDSGILSNSTEAKPSRLPESPSFLQFPVIGSKSGDWQLTEAQVAEWASLFPGHDIRGECRMALAWVRANNGRRKTDRGMAKFLVSWLTRAADRRQGPKAVTATPEYSEPWVCPHVVRCAGRSQCEQATFLGRPEKGQASA